ncbi:Uncharacterized protein PBTT_03890 [Plasmodiophora brassicae]
MDMVLHWALAVALVECSVTFPSAPSADRLHALDLYAPAATSFLGPQPGDASSNRSGRVALFSGNLCEPTTMRCPGCVILTTDWTASCAACSFEVQYLNLYATGAVAVIRKCTRCCAVQPVSMPERPRTVPQVDQVPSVTVYGNDGSRGARTRHLEMLFLQVGPSRDVYDTLIATAPGQDAAVHPDVNVWQATMASWYYQLFVRILPSAVLIVAGTIAMLYFAFHMRLINNGYRSDVPAAVRCFDRWATFVRGAVGLPHAVLAIEMVTATLSGIVLAIGGFYSTPNLPYPVVQCFLSLLSGWSLVCSLLSASVWVRHLADLLESTSWLTRVFRGDHPHAFAVLLVIPVVIDTAISAMWATNFYLPLVSSIVAATLFVFQLTVGLYVLMIVLRYYTTVRDVQSQAKGFAAGSESGMQRLLTRLCRCALGMSLSTIMVCLGTLMAVSTPFLFSPTGWTICFALTYNGRALDSAFRVAMFKPRFDLGDDRDVRCVPSRAAQSIQ